MYILNHVKHGNRNDIIAILYAATCSIKDTLVVLMHVYNKVSLCSQSFHYSKHVTCQKARQLINTNVRMLR